ncbi:MAG: YcxB family protein [Colwellia sp.]
MKTPFTFSTRFILDKAHFTECYQESSTVKRTLNAFLKSAILIAFGLILLLFTQVNAYTAWFVVALGILEALSLYYHQPWWVLRQMLSRASNSEVNLTIDEQGVLSESFYSKSRVLWSDVTEIKVTHNGFVLFFMGGKSYLSNKGLSKEAQTFMNEKGLLIKESIGLDE